MIKLIINKKNFKLKISQFCRIQHLTQKKLRNFTKKKKDLKKGRLFQNFFFYLLLQSLFQFYLVCYNNFVGLFIIFIIVHQIPIPSILFSKWKKKGNTFFCWTRKLLKDSKNKWEIERKVSNNEILGELVCENCVAIEKIWSCFL
jgi:hypothetical protein